MSNLPPLGEDALPVFEVKKPCPVIGGCACIGICQETIEVVAAADYWCVIGERNEARRIVAEVTKTLEARDRLAAWIEENHEGVQVYRDNGLVVMYQVVPYGT